MRRDYLLVVLGMSASVWLDARSCNVWSREKTAHRTRGTLFTVTMFRVGKNSKLALKTASIPEGDPSPPPWARKHSDRGIPYGCQRSGPIECFLMECSTLIITLYRYSVQKRGEDEKKVEKRSRAHRKACVDLEIGRRRQWRRWRWPSIAERGGGGGLLALVRVQGLCPYLPLDRCFKLDPIIPTDTSIRRTVAAVWRFSAKSSFVFTLCVYFVVYNPIYPSRYSIRL